MEKSKAKTHRGKLLEGNRWIGHTTWKGEGVVAMARERMELNPVENRKVESPLRGPCEKSWKGLERRGRNRRNITREVAKLWRPYVAGGTKRINST